MTIQPKNEVQLSLPGWMTDNSLELPRGLSYEQWEDVGRGLQKIERGRLWWAGDWLLYGERNFGEKCYQAIEGVTGLSHESIRRAATVCDKFPIGNRFPDVPFGHHMMVAGVQDPPIRDRMLQEAKDRGYSQRELQALVAAYNEALNPPLPPPSGLYDVILADPPWQYDNTGVHGAAEHHYKTMPLDQIKGLKDKGYVPAMDNAILFLWVTNPFLEDALEVVEAWGFEYKTNMVWVKRHLQKPGSGFYVRGRHELLFICTKGSHTPDQKGKEPIGSFVETEDQGTLIVEADVLEHSRKPVKFYEVIEAMFPEAQRLELFARGMREGWTCWGDELAPDID